MSRPAAAVAILATLVAVLAPAAAAAARRAAPLPRPTRLAIVTTHDAATVTWRLRRDARVRRLDVRVRAGVAAPRALRARAATRRLVVRPLPASATIVVRVRACARSRCSRWARASARTLAPPPVETPALRLATGFATVTATWAVPGVTRPARIALSVTAGGDTQTLDLPGTVTRRSVRVGPGVTATVRVAACDARACATSAAATATTQGFQPVEAPPRPQALGPLPLVGFGDLAYAVTHPDAFWADSAELGSTSTHVFVDWAAWTRDPERTLRQVDDLLRRANAAGLVVMLTISNPPLDPDETLIAPERLLASHAALLRALLARSAGALRYRDAVASWEPYNEPNCCDAWKLPSLQYVTLLDRAYAQIHAAYRGAAVPPDVVGGAWCPCSHGRQGALYQAQVLADAIAHPDAYGISTRLFDSLSVHPYPDWRRPSTGLEKPGTGEGVNTGDIGRMLLVMDRLWPGRRVRLHLSEFGWMTAGGAYGKALTPTRQARETCRFLEEVRHWNTAGRIASIGWFLIVDDVRTDRPSWLTGLRTAPRDPAAPDASKKPAFETWKRYVTAPPQTTIDCSTLVG